MQEKCGNYARNLKIYRKQAAGKGGGIRVLRDGAILKYATERKRSDPFFDSLKTGCPENSLL